MRRADPRFGRLAVAAVAVALAGCAGFSADGGFSPVEQVARERLGKELRWTRDGGARAELDARVAGLLATPLSADAAVQIALWNNAGLQADFAELGIAEADWVQAGRLPNPGFTFGRSRRGDEAEIERGLHLNLARLVALPWLREVESRRFARTQAEVAGRVLDLAGQTRRAWVQAVAAGESVRYARQVMEAAETGAELARRMAAVGNFSRLQRSREEAFYAEAALRQAQAQQAQTAARERLTRLLGLWGAQTAFRLPERLPDLPAVPRELPDVEQLAVAQRLDLLAARRAMGAADAAGQATAATRFTGGLELGLMRNGSNEGPPQTGWEIGVEIPLFDGGAVRAARAAAQQAQAQQRALDAAVAARSEVREAYAAYRSAWDIARHHRDELVPLRQRISEENLLRYNGMIIGVFELLADARAQIAGVDAAIDALRAFWLAEAGLEMALIGRPGAALPGGGAPAAAGPAAADPGH